MRGEEPYPLPRRSREQPGGNPSRRSPHPPPPFLSSPPSGRTDGRSPVGVDGGGAPSPLARQGQRGLARSSGGVGRGGVGLAWGAAAWWRARATSSSCWATAWRASRRRAWGGGGGCCPAPKAAGGGCWWGTGGSPRGGRWRALRLSGDVRLAAAAGGYDARALHGRMRVGQVSLRYTSGCRRRVARLPSPAPAHR